jgi:hypothetical protein
MVFVCIVQLKRKPRQFLRAQPHSAGTGAIRSASTDQGRVRIMEEWLDGFKKRQRRIVDRTSDDLG